MDFRLTDEQQMIAATMREAIGDLSSTAGLRAMIRDGAQFDSARWSALAELGLCGMMIPEDAGGLGLGPVEMAQVAEACGAALLPEPLVTSAGVAAPLLAELGMDVAALAAGAGHAVLAHPARPFVPHAAAAAQIVLATATQGVLTGAPGAFELVAQPAADPLIPLFTVAPGPGAQPVAAGPATGAAVARAITRERLFAAAEMLGIARAAVALATDYAKERHQFGRPIGANQAVKHMLAEVQVGIEFLRPVVEAAAGFLAADHPAAAAHVAHAHLRAARVVDHATRVALQVHGAMGYSWEADPHLYLKRGMLLAEACGPRLALLDLVAERARTAHIGPGALFA